MTNRNEGAGNDTPGTALPPLEVLAPRIARSLKEPLPGRDAQRRMAPLRVDGELLHGGRLPEPGAAPAAALVLLYSRGDSPTVLLTLRSADLPAHPGQIGLPGGMQHPGESLIETALRETTEEIGVSEQDVEVLGALTPLFIPPSRILLHPFVAAARRSPSFRPRPAEVERLLEIPIASILDPGSEAREPRRVGGEDVIVPCFRFEGDRVWGATAMILAELREILRGLRFDRPPGERPA